MKKEKKQEIINKANMLVADMNLYLEGEGIIDKYTKKKEYLRSVAEYAACDSKFATDIFDVGMRMMLLEHIERKEMCKKCEDRWCEEDEFDYCGDEDMQFV